MWDGSHTLYGPSALPSIVTPMDNQINRFAPPQKVHAVIKTTVVDFRVQRLSRKYLDGSLTNQGAKQKRQFDRLSSSDKREWREALQRAIANVKNHCAMQALRGGKLRGKSAHRFERMTKLEAALISQFDERVEFQSGIAVAAGSVAAASIAFASYQTKKVSDSVATAVDTGNDLMRLLIDQINGFVSKITDVGSVMSKIALAILLVWMMVNYGHLPIFVAVVLACAGSYLPEAIEMIKSIAPKGISLQNGGVSLAAHLLSLGCTMWIPGKDVKSVTGEFLKRASYFPRATEGIEAFMKKGLEMFEGFINFVLRRNEESWISLQGKTDVFVSWKRKVIAMLKFMQEQPVVPIEKIRECKDLLLTGYGLYQVLVTQESKRELNFWIEKLAVKMQPHQGALQAESNIRPMPYFIMIGGSTGVGKTSLMRLIGSTILMLSGEVKPSEALEHLWQKGTTEYWNGYVGQKCLIMDDAFQVKGKPGDMDSEAMQVIRAVGNWSYPLNFADLESKGKFYLDTPLVIGTTNSRNVKAEWAPFITEPEALVRRFQGSYWIELNPDYKTEDGRFDFTKVNDEFRGALQRIAAMKSEGRRLSVSDVMDQMPWQVWTLKQHGFDRENISEDTAPGGLRNAVEIAAREIRQRRESNVEQIQDLKNWTSILGEALDADLELQSGLPPSMSAFVNAMSETGISDTVNRRLFEVSTRQDEIQEESQWDIPMIGVQPDDFVGWLSSDDDRSETQSMVDGVYIMPEAEVEHHGILRKLYDVLTSWFDKLPIRKMVAGVLAAAISYMTVSFVLGIVIKLVCAAVTAVWALLSSIFKLFGFKKSECEFQSNDGTVHTVKNRGVEIATFNSLQRVNLHTGIESQVGVPPTEAVHDHVYANTLLCTIDGAIVGQFLGLGQDVYIFPKHFLLHIRKMDPGMVMKFTSVRHGVAGTISCRAFLQCNMQEVPGYDIAGVSFGAVFMKANKNILHFFLANHEVKSLLRGNNTAVRLDVAHPDKDGKVQRYIYHSNRCEYVGSVTESTRGDKLSGLVKYEAATVKGDCGAPLTVAENRYYGGRCVMGLHSAGRDSAMLREGYATVVTQEVARELFKTLSTYHEDIARDDIIDVPEGETLINLQTALDAVGLTSGSFELIGTLVEPVNISTSSKLKPSDMQRDQVFGPTPLKPAVLRTVEVDGVVQHPMVNGVKAYQTDLECKSVRDLELVTEIAMQKHWQATEKHSRDILSFEDAVVPPEHWKLKPFNRKTSAGYKYRKFVTPTKPGKVFALGLEGDVDFANENLQKVKEDTLEIISKAKEGVRTLHLCTDFLKDELRPLAKVESVATRVIAGTEFDYSVAVRMYFGAYMAAMFDTYVSNGMAPGINHYKEWFMLAEALTKVGNNIFDGDFSRFDSSEQPWVHISLLGYINRWYRFNNDKWSLEDDRVRYILWLDLVHSRHITGVGSRLQYVVQWNKSLPSGHPLTTIVNSMYSLVTLTGCYIAATGELNMWDNAYLCTFGDDNVNSVSDEKRDEFNQVTVAHWMKELFGLAYTAGHKDAQLVPYTSLDKVTFLKRSFLVDDDDAGGLIVNTPNNGWVAPLALESFLYEGYWYKNSRDVSLDLVTRIEHSVLEMALHEQHVWDKYFPRLEEWCSRSGVCIGLKNRSAARNEVKTRFDVWF